MSQPSASPDPPNSPPTEPTPRRRRWPWIAAAVAVVLAATAGLVLWLRPTAPPLGEEAAKACQEQVSLKLTSPGSAQWLETAIEDQGGGTWSIEGQVDAQNGFGALVRMEYSCEMYTEDQQRWTSHAVKID